MEGTYFCEDTRLLDNIFQYINMMIHDVSYTAIQSWTSVDCKLVITYCLPHV